MAAKSPMLGRRFCLALAGITFTAMTGCMSLSQEKPGNQLMELAAINTSHGKTERVFDPVSGATYIIPCNPCSVPPPKTIVAASSVPAPYPSAIQATQTARELNETHQTIAAAAPAKMTDSMQASTDHGGPNLKMDTLLASVQRIVPFAFAASTIGPHGQKALAEIVPLARQAQRINIRGHTDNRGNVMQNQLLALSRANTVKQAMVAAGAPTKAIETTSCATCYISANNSETGRRINRRVEIELIMPAMVAANLPRPIHSAPDNNDGPGVLAKLDDHFTAVGKSVPSSSQKENNIAH